MDEVYQKFECPICLKQFNDPVECPNQHCFSRSFIKDAYFLLTNVLNVNMISYRRR